MPNDPVTTTTNSAGAPSGATSITEPTGPSGDTGTTPPAILGASRDGLQPGDVGYQGPPPPIPGDVSGAPGTGTVPAAGEEEVAAVQESLPHGPAHVIVQKDTVSTLRRLMSDVGRGTEDAMERFRDAFNRVF